MSDPRLEIWNALDYLRYRAGAILEKNYTMAFAILYGNDTKEYPGYKMDQIVPVYIKKREEYEEKMKVGHHHQIPTSELILMADAALKPYTMLGMKPYTFETYFNLQADRVALINLYREFEALINRLRILESQQQEQNGSRL